MFIDLRGWHFSFNKQIHCYRRGEQISYTWVPEFYMLCLIYVGPKYGICDYASLSSTSRHPKVRCREGSQVSLAWCDKNVIKIMMSMELGWNNTGRWALKYWETNLSQCHFVHHRIPCWLTCDQAQAFAIGCCLLTTWALAWPLPCFYTYYSSCLE